MGKAGKILRPFYKKIHIFCIINTPSFDFPRLFWYPRDITKSYVDCTKCCESFLQATIRGHKMGEWEGKDVHNPKPCPFVIKDKGCKQNAYFLASKLNLYFEFA